MKPKWVIEDFANDNSVELLIEEVKNQNLLQVNGKTLIQIKMILYTEIQLETAYNIYSLHQISQFINFMDLESFRKLYEELVTEIV